MRARDTGLFEAPSNSIMGGRVTAGFCWRLNSTAQPHGRRNARASPSKQVKRRVATRMLENCLRKPSHSGCVDGASHASMLMKTEEEFSGNELRSNHLVRHGAKERDKRTVLRKRDATKLPDLSYMMSKGKYLDSRRRPSHWSTLIQATLRCWR